MLHKTIPELRGFQLQIFVFLMPVSGGPLGAALLQAAGFDSSFGLGSGLLLYLILDVLRVCCHHGHRRCPGDLIQSSLVIPGGGRVWGRGWFQDPSVDTKLQGRSSLLTGPWYPWVLHLPSQPTASCKHSMQTATGQIGGCGT